MARDKMSGRAKITFVVFAMLYSLSGVLSWVESLSISNVLWNQIVSFLLGAVFGGCVAVGLLAWKYGDTWLRQILKRE